MNIHENMDVSKNSVTNGVPKKIPFKGNIENIGISEKWSKLWTPKWTLKRTNLD